MAHGYDTGRLDLPFVGIPTFGKYPLCLDWDRIDADVAVLGAPFDFGTQWRAGARFGPRAIREASTLFSFGHSGAYDHEDDVVYLAAEATRIADIGDADIVHTDTIASHANIEAAVRTILAAGALPVTLGGDHSITIPTIAAFSEHGPIHVVQFDAHLDFVDERLGCIARATQRIDRAACPLQCRLVNFAGRLRTSSRKAAPRKRLIASVRARTSRSRRS